MQGMLAHYTAEALLSAPGLLGSLDLLLNPTGLLSSVSAGLADLLGLPLAALMAGSPAQVSASCFPPVLALTCSNNHMHVSDMSSLGAVLHAMCVISMGKTDWLPCLQFVASLGRGPASLLWHVSGWTLTSISGFSTAASHVLKRSLASRPSPRCRCFSFPFALHILYHGLGPLG